MVREAAILEAQEKKAALEVPFKLACTTACETASALRML